MTARHASHFRHAPHSWQNAQHDPDGLRRAVLDTLTPRGLLDEMSDAVVIVDDVGITEYLNLRAASLLGVTPVSARGERLEELFTLLNSATLKPIADPLDWLRARVGVPPGIQFEQVQRRDGETIPVDIAISLLRRADRTPAGMVLVLRDVSGYQARLDRLIEVARYDDGTHLLRRVELERRLERVLRSMVEGDPQALLFMDLDHFKQINDAASHLVGDRALREVAELFRAQVRERDTLARLGGDEFGLLLEHCPLPLARERAQALRVAVSKNGFQANGCKFRLEVSIGIAAFHCGRHDAQAVMAAADAACYAAKRLDGNANRICESVLD